MFQNSCAAFFGMVMLGVAGTAHALPMMVDYNDINVATLEDFESFPAFDVQTGAEVYNGFTASADSGNWIIGASSTFCDTSGDQCLMNQTATNDTRTFDTFASGTNFFGLDLTAIGEQDDFQINVNGSSGLNTFVVTGSEMLGFGDTAGLASVSVTNLGDGSGFSNYGLDDIITGTSANLSDNTPSIPEPATLALFGLGLGGVGVLARRRRSPQ